MTRQYDTRASRSAKSIIRHRRLKVRETYHPYQLNQHSDDRTPVGEIQLKGHWLIQAGFNINAPVTIRVMEGCLVLTAGE
jgi:hypothetical protein